MKNYFRFWLFAPLLLGLVDLLLPAVTIGVVSFAGSALLVAGIPYVGFIVCALVWSGNRSEAEYLGAFLISPLIFGVFCFVYLVLLYPVSGIAVTSWSSKVLDAFRFAMFCAATSGLYCLPPLALWQLVVLIRRR